MTRRVIFRSSFPVTRILACILCVVAFPLWLFAAQTQTDEFARELEAGKQAAGKGDYADALSHFFKANNLHENKCSECFVWLARIEMAKGNLKQALDWTEKASASAVRGPERASAQLYRGIVLSRQGNLGLAETAFKAASAANPACVECKFNLGFVLLKEAKDGEGVEVLKTVASEFAGTPRGREIQRLIDDPSRIRKNYAPEFAAKTQRGEEINLDALKGKVVLLDFWGTWCSPCRVSLPLLKDLASRVDPAKVAIISIDEGDTKEKWKQFIQEEGMTWAQVYDPDWSLHQAFAVDGYPRYFVLGKDGIIVEEFKGWNQNGEATISNAIARALQE